MQGRSDISFRSHLGWDVADHIDHVATAILMRQIYWDHVKTSHWHLNKTDQSETL